MSELESIVAPATVANAGGSPRGTDPGPRRLGLVLAVSVGIAAAVPFIPVIWNGWVMFDDDGNFLNNVDFRGVGWPQLAWAWTTFRLGVYQPLAWMLLEVQYAFFGLNPGGYHLTSLVLHSLVAVAFFMLTTEVLSRILSPTNRRDRSTVLVASSLAATLFAVHPLRVEVVAWASCQPYLPCALFSLLGALAYLRAFEPGKFPRVMWLVAAWWLFLAAQLSKAVAITLPVVLVIIDSAVLGRIDFHTWAGQSVRRVLREKVPFLATSSVFLVIALFAKRSNDSLMSVANDGLARRFIVSCYSIAFYLMKTIWPLGLTAYYQLPGASLSVLLSPPFILGIPAVVLITLAVALQYRRRPTLLAAWLAFLIILAPNMGLFRISNQIAADRYSYVASMPLFMALAHGFYRLIVGARRDRRRLVALACTGLIAVCVLGGLSWSLCRTWRDSDALWENTYRQGYRNSTVLYNLGANAEARGEIEVAKSYYLWALRVNPLCNDAHNLLGAVLDREGRHDEAMVHFAEAIRIEPGYSSAQNNLGAALARQGRLDQAIVRFTEAVRLEPESALPRKNLAKALVQTGQLRRALPEYHEAARLAPDDANVRNDYGMALARAGRLDEAMSWFAKAARLDPRSAATQINWGLALEQSGRPGESLSHFAEAVRLEPDRVDNHLLFAATLAVAGRTREAVAEWKAALRLDPGNRQALEGLGKFRVQSEP